MEERGQRVKSTSESRLWGSHGTDHVSQSRTRLLKMVFPVQANVRHEMTVTRPLCLFTV